MRFICGKVLLAILGLHVGVFMAPPQVFAGGTWLDGSRFAADTVPAHHINDTPQEGRDHDIEFSRSWIDEQPKATGGDEWKCLAEALYFEARGETIKGQFAVAEVILNRVESERFPSSACGVINQGTGKKYQCQFTYTCDGYREVIAEPRAYERVAKVARAALDGEVPALTEGATHYHTKAVSPRWSKVYTKTTAIGTHVFYRHTWRTASN